MAAAKGSEDDRMAVAVFCLEQARRALALVRGSPRSQDSETDLSGFEANEYYILKLQHVYRSCCILNRSWVPVFPSSVRHAANAFIQRWNDSDGQNLRNALTHYEEALANPNHHLRGQAHSYGRVRGVLQPEWRRLHTGVATRRAEGLFLLGKQYWLHGVHEALVELEREFSAVLIDPETGLLREDA